MNQNIGNEIENNNDRCIGFLKSGKKCRYRLGSNNRIFKFFCCDEHVPFNSEFFEQGCNICMDDNLQTSEIKILKCGHVIHKPCLEEWKKNRYDDTDKCYICRGEFNIKIPKTNVNSRYYINDKGVKFALNRQHSLENKFLITISNVQKNNNLGDQINFI